MTVVQVFRRADVGDFVETEEHSTCMPGTLGGINTWCSSAVWHHNGGQSGKANIHLNTARDSSNITTFFIEHFERKMYPFLLANFLNATSAGKFELKFSVHTYHML